MNSRLHHQIVGFSDDFVAAFRVAAVMLVVGMAAYLFFPGKIEPVPNPAQ